MSCAHCLRGEQENKDINVNILDFLFSQINSIYKLTISGGEPSLASNKIKQIINLAIKKNVEIKNFYIATNLKVFNYDFLEAVKELGAYCSLNSCSQFEISKDKYHKNIKLSEEEKQKLMKVSYFNKEGNYLSDKILFKMGRSEHGQLIKETSIFVKKGILYGDIYVNVNGDIINGSNWSYKEQENHIIKDMIKKIKN